MFKTIIIVALVFFAAGLITWKSMAREEKSVMANEDIDWDDYGRVKKGEIELGLTLNPSDLAVTISVKNMANHSLHIFAHSTGRNGKFYNDRLSVTVNNEPVRYKGPMYKIAIGKDWFETLEPGAVFSNSFDLRDYYAFDAKEGDVLSLEFEYGTEKAVARIIL